MKILAVESSAKAASAAVWEDGRLLSEAFVNVGLTHSQTLLPMVQSALENAGLVIGEIGGFAVSHGPGSFTGIRIGVSAVKGMAQGTGRPCLGVSTLESLAYQVKHMDGTLVSLMDARCNQYYTASFSCSGGRLTRLTDDEALTHEELTKRLEKQETPLIFVGDGALLCYNKMEAGRKKNVILATEQLRYARASAVAEAAAEALSAGGVPAAQLRPRYLRLPQAERERLKKEGIQKEERV